MDDKLRELLDADVSKIAEEGKKSNRSKLQKIIVVTVLAVVIGIAVHIGLKESAYRKALTLADEGNYTEAMTAFENLKGYRSSKENAENVTHANNFMKSAVSHAQSEQLSKELSSYKTVFPDINFDTSFDWRTETFIIRVSSDNFSKSDMEVTDELTSAILPSFIALCHDIDRSSQSIQTACKVSGGYSVDCSIECIGTDGELLYSSQNGEEKTSCIDIAATEDKLYGPSYQKMVDAVDAKEYAKCYETWDVLNADGYYDLSYKDISDYYYYARAMSAYTSSEAVSLSQLKSDLKNISEDFKNTKDIKDKITEITESVGSVMNGTYHKDFCEFKIENGGLTWKFVSGSEKGNNLSAKIDDYFIKNGKVFQAHAVEAETDGQGGVTVTKTDSGVKVTFDNSDDEAKYGGMYLSGAVSEEVKTTKNVSNTTANGKGASTAGTSTPVSVTGVLADIQGSWKGDYYKLTIRGNAYTLNGKINYIIGGAVLYSESGTVTVGGKYGAYYYLSFAATQHKETNEQGEQINPHEKGGFGLHAYYDDKGKAQITGYTRIG